MQTTRLQSRILMVIVPLLAFLCVDVLLSLVFCPYAGLIEVVWSAYRNSIDEDINTLVIGSSYAQLDIDPLALDEELGSSSFNLGTLGQSLPDTLAALRVAVDDHDLQRVIICLGPESLQDTYQFDRQICFMQAKSAGESLPDMVQNASRVALDSDNISTSKSLAWIVPWQYNLVDWNPQSVLQNVRDRLSGKTPEELAPRAGAKWIYKGRGFGGYTCIMNTDEITVSTLDYTHVPPFREKNTQEFIDLLDACAQTGARTYVIVAPQPSYMCLARNSKEYVTLMKKLKEISEAHGATYHDMNLTKPDFLRLANESFEDPAHLNLNGAEQLGSALAEVIERDESNESVSDLLFSYDDWKAYLDSFEDIALCDCGYTLSDTRIELVADSIAKPGVKVEYQFAMMDDGSQSYEVIRDFATNPTCELPISDHGKVKLRVTARPSHSKDATEMREKYLNINY